MSGPGGAGPDPPLTGGEFLLSLLQKSPQYQQQRHHHQQQHQHQQQTHQVPDSAIAAAFGPLAFHPNLNNNNNGNNNWSPLPPDFYGLPGSNQPRHQWSHIPAHLQGFAADGATAGLRDSDNGGLGLGLGFQSRQEPLLTFGSFPAPIHNRGTLLHANLMNSRNVGLPNFPVELDRNGTRSQPPPGFVGAGRGVERRDLSEVDLAGMRILGDLGLSKQLDHPGLPAGSKLHSVGASDVEESMRILHAKLGGERKNSLDSKNLLDDDDEDEIDELSKKIGDSLGINDDEVDDNSKKFIKNWDKDARSDTRGHQLLNQRQRIYKRQIKCRADVVRLDAPLIAIYDSLIPSEEEKAKQKQLLCLLERLVNREWPNAKLYVYGSCANSFGVSKSDIDICFALEGADNNKPEILLKLEEILESDNLKNVQALVRARVPIVKLMDPATEISCDICINNVLAVVNSKLLRDYAQIDVRLRQLAFIVKHWAKSRRVNETYHGTLSSYAYVLMCIHFLQQRRPAILPCLQGMKTTYSVTIENVHCAFFDQVDQLQDFGHRNNESISQLVWSFFNYWAYVHDYANSVISVRTGTLLSKRGKDWTRRIGNDRHLICIEDPFETSHDLGRVVDKYSIKVLREEFERAAEVMQHDPNPCVKLFEPYVTR